LPEVEGGKATFGKLKMTLGSDTKGGESKGEQQPPRGTTTVSGFAHNVMDRSAKLKTQMMSMMDRTGGQKEAAAGQPGGAAAGGQAEKESSDEEDPLQASSSPDRRAVTGNTRRPGSRLQRLGMRNKENVAEASASDKEGGSALDKLTQRLKKRGVARRNSKETEENAKHSDSDPEEAEGKAGDR
jgi:hypothetical protein